jgi:asparagine synthase (glutamine-hydrolysing)
MQWVTGWLPFRLGSSPTPRGGVRVPAAHGFLWATGYPASEIKSVADDHGNQLTLLGPCLPSPRELDAALSNLTIERWCDIAVWPGSYVAIASRRDDTLISGDLAGRARIYFVDTGRGILWANAVTPLAAYVGAPLRLRSLAIGLAVSGDPYGGQTPFEGIGAVPPGSVLRINRNRASIHRWYRPLADATFDETVERLRSLLPDVIERRVEGAGGRITFDLSGGIDSGTLVALAARRGQALGITYVDSGIDNDDLQHARRIAACCPSVDHRVVYGGRSNLYFTMLHEPGTLPRTDLPSMSCTRLDVRAAVLDVAARQHSRIHVSGEAGDIALHAESTALAGLYREGHRLEAIRRVAAAARLRQTAPAARVRAMIRLAHSSPADELRRVAVAIRERRYPTHFSSSPQVMSGAFLRTGVGWLTPEVADWIGDLLLRLADEDTNDGEAPEELPSWEFVRDIALDHVGSDELARGRGISIHTPFMDNLVLRTCLSLPGWQRRGVEKFKPLVTVGLAALLPLPLTTRTTKGSFDYSYQEGLRQNAAALRRIISNSILIREGIVSERAAEDGLRRMIHGLELGDTSLDLLLSRELWLAQIDTERSTWWEEDGNEQGTPDERNL